MDFNCLQLKKEIKGRSLKRDSSYGDKRLKETVHYWDRLTFHNVNDRHEFYSEDRAEISSGSEIIQCARRDWKKEKWKQGRGKLNWKHGRKNGFDMKHQVFEEDTDVEDFAEEDIDVGDFAEEVALRPIVSDILREKKFDETHYVAPVVLLESFYWDTVSSDDCGLRDYIREICTKLDFEKDYAIVYKIFEEKGKKIIEDCPGIRECVTETGNCGGVANFLFEGNTSTDEDDFNKLMQELREEVPEDKVKLIKIQANIGHVFTLICYKQGDKTVVELIQAWQGKYSVKKSLNDAGVKNIYSLF